MKYVLVLIALLAALLIGPSAANAAPTASYTFSPSDPYTQEAVSFNGSASTCDRAPCTYTWTDDGPDGPGGTNYNLGSGPGR